MLDYILSDNYNVVWTSLRVIEFYHKIEKNKTLSSVSVGWVHDFKVMRKKDAQNLILPPLTVLLGHLVQNDFCALIKKILIHIIKFFFKFWDPQTNKMNLFAYEVLGIKIGGNGCVEFISE